ALLQRQGFSRPLALGVVVVEVLVAAALVWLLCLDSGAPATEVLGNASWLLPLQLAGLTVLVLVPRIRAVTLPLAVLLSGCLVVELARYDAPFIRAQALPDLRVADRLFAREKIDRVATNCDGVIQPNDMMALGVPTVNGYNSVFFQSYAALTFLTMN